MTNFMNVFYPEDFSYNVELQRETKENLITELECLKDNLISCNKVIWDLLISDTAELNQILDLFNKAKIEEDLYKFINPYKYELLRELLVEKQKFDDVMVERLINVMKIHDFSLIVYSLHTEAEQEYQKINNIKGEIENGNCNAEDNREKTCTGETE